MPLEIPLEMRFVLCSLAVWRLTHLIVAENGPWDLVVRLRAAAGESQFGTMMDCFYCTSLWIALPFVFAMARDFLFGLIAWLALSGAASLLEQLTNCETFYASSTTHLRKGTFP